MKSASEARLDEVVVYFLNFPLLLRCSLFIMSVIPDAVKSFLSSFAQALRDPASTGFSGITHLYDQQWSKLTDKYYKQSEWPTSSAIAEIVQNGTRIA